MPNDKPDPLVPQMSLTSK